MDKPQSMNLKKRKKIENYAGEGSSSFVSTTIESLTVFSFIIYGLIKVINSF